MPLMVSIAALVMRVGGVKETIAKENREDLSKGGPPSVDKKSANHFHLADHLSK